MHPKSYDYCTEIKKEATATQTLFYFSETIFFFFLTSSQLLQEEKFKYKTGKHKKPKNKIYFPPPFHCFPIT